MASITLNNLTKTFGDGFTAVQNLNLEIKDGEFVVFVGPSGCGKSTTLRMIAGLESVSSGTISIGDRVVNTVAPKDRDIAMVFQNYALYPHLSVEDNMGFALRMSKMPKDERAARVLEAAKMLGLEDILNKKPGQLSGGQRQRVALGRAVVRKPAVFLFDEPLSNLDPDRRASTRAEIRRIQRELGTTTVYVTHDHEEAMALGDQIVLLDEGVLQQAGSPGELFDQPANQFVGTFLGAPKMNILPATLDRGGDRVIARVDCGGSQLQIQLDDARVPVRADHGDRVSIGIRPHCIRIEEGASQSRASFQGRVCDMERLGFAVDLHIEVGPHTLLARVGGDCALYVGDTSTFAFDPSMAHAFIDERKASS
jgi:multiple sugar transport system ATP-binding protein